MNLADTTRCYKVVTTLYLASLLAQVNQLTGGAVTVTPKLVDCRTPVTDLTANIVRLPPAMGNQELKGWQALIQYLKAPGVGPVVPAVYSAPQHRIATQ